MNLSELAIFLNQPSPKEPTTLMDLMEFMRTNDAPPPMRQGYGQRYNPETGKLNSSEQKSYGFYGPLKDAKGNAVSEYGASAPINGREVEYPTLVPGMSPAQIQAVLDAAGSDRPPPPDIADMAYEHAVKRIQQGKSPYWNFGQDQFPAWSPDQDWLAR